MCLHTFADDGQSFRSKEDCRLRAAEIERYLPVRSACVTLPRVDSTYLESILHGELQSTNRDNSHAPSGCRLRSPVLSLGLHRAKSRSCVYTHIFFYLYYRHASKI